MKIEIILGKEQDIDEIEQLYYELNEYLERGINYPGWRRDVYPVRQNAVEGIRENALFIARKEGKIIGSIILNHKPEKAYEAVKWNIEEEYANIIVIHTFAVHPQYLKCGIGTLLMEFTIEHSRKEKAKAIRLDVYEKNIPAIHLYEKSGFHYVDTVDLGLQDYGLHWFKVYEMLL